jgi:hypothetical protein
MPIIKENWYKLASLSLLNKDVSKKDKEGWSLIGVGILLITASTYYQ